ncbi:MAG TPA: hypothetical protein VIV60_31245, partial [Polyangiaceae bacterium]
MSKAPSLAALARRVEERLVRHGIAGRVEIEDVRVRLVAGRDSDISVVIDEIAEWDSTIPDQRGQLVERIVSELVRVRRAAAPSTGISALLQWARLVTVLGLIAVGCCAAWRWLGKPAHDAFRSSTQAQAAIAPSLAIAPVPTAKAQLTTAERCARVQARIATGGTVSPLDVDGWVVELALLSDSTSLVVDSPALERFLSKPVSTVSEARQLTWAEDTELRGIGDADSFAVVAEEPLAGVILASKSGIRITWSGKYVETYFNETTRSKLQRLAGAIFDATHSKLGALYARCAATSIHQAGSWFRGSDLSSAMLAMVA